MSSENETKLIELFARKIDEIRKEFDDERKRMRKVMNGFLIGFGALLVTFIFSSGVIVQKVNSLEKNYYEVAEKVDILYMVAVRNGDIEFSTRGVEKTKN